MVGVVNGQRRVCRLGGDVVVGGTGDRLSGVLGVGVVHGDDRHPLGMNAGSAHGISGVLGVGVVHSDDRHPLGMNAGSAHNERLLVCVIVFTGVFLCGDLGLFARLSLWRLTWRSRAISCSRRRLGDIIRGGCAVAFVVAGLG